MKQRKSKGGEVKDGPKGAEEEKGKQEGAERLLEISRKGVVCCIFFKDIFNQGNNEPDLLPLLVSSVVLGVGALLKT